MAEYVALIRGINVGGKNKVAMADLRVAFEQLGYSDVRTYINSGNVLFRSSRALPKTAEAKIENALEKTLNLPLVVVLRTKAQFRKVVDKAPDGFGNTPKKYHSDVVFLKAPLTSRQAMKVVQLREGVDRAWAGAGVVYFERLSAQRTKSRMGKIVGTPEYQLMTIRSWNTTTKLLSLLDTPR